jgi:hypothetical protein
MPIIARPPTAITPDGTQPSSPPSQCAMKENAIKNRKSEATSERISDLITVRGSRRLLRRRALSRPTKGTALLTIERRGTPQPGSSGSFTTRGRRQ